MALGCVPLTLVCVCVCVRLAMDDNQVHDIAGLNELGALRSLSAKNNRMTSTAGLPPNLETVNLAGAAHTLSLPEHSLTGAPPQATPSRSSAD